LKKHLLSTSAIALGVAMAAPASAQQWDLDWGGFANTHIGAADVDSDQPGDFDGVDVFTNSEIIFSPNVTLDNGLTFGFSVQLEALNTSASSRIDESYVTIEGDNLGRIVLGSENSAGYALMGSVYTPGGTTMAINSRSTSAFVPVTGSTGFRQAAQSSLTEVGGNNDVQRISYFTPSFNGLTVGVSYAADGDTNAENNFAPDRDSGLKDIFDIGVGYQQSFGGVDLGLAARWGTGDRNGSAGTTATSVLTPGGDVSAAALAAIASGAEFNDVNGNGIVDAGDTVGGSAGTPGGDPTTWAVGGTLGVNAFTFGATYAENDNDSGGPGDQEGYSFGVDYDLVGPWSIGAQMYYGEEKTTNNDNEYETYLVGATRDLGAGVSWDVYYYYMETKNGLNGNKIEGNVIATAINLSF
jgi:hypothetical protein